MSLTLRDEKIIRRNAAANRTLNRWPEWYTEFNWRRIGPSYRLGIWSADWTGPMGGHYSFLGLTQQAVLRRIAREMARWDKKRSRRS